MRAGHARPPWSGRCRGRSGGTSARAARPSSRRRPSGWPGRRPGRPRRAARPRPTGRGRRSRRGPRGTRRATSSAVAPVSAAIRGTNVIPIELMTSFVTMVAMISRRSGWFGSRWPNLSTTSGGKYSASAETRYGSSGSDDSNTWSRSRRLAYARSTHSSGRVMPWPARDPIGHELARRQRLKLPLEQVPGLELDHEVLERLHPPRRDRRLLAQDLDLEVVVVEHEADHVVCDLVQDLVSALERQLAALDRDREQDLQVDLVVGAVDAAGVVDRVGVDPAAAVARTRSGRAG